MFYPTNVKVKVKRENKEAKIPKYGNVGDACADLPILEDVCIKPNDTVVLDTGLIFEIPKRYELKVYIRSSIGIKKKIRLSNSTGVIDSQYRKSLKLGLHNYGKEEVVLKKGERVAQFQVKPLPEMVFVEVDEVSETDRGEGLGSSGRY